MIVRCRKCMWPQVSDDSHKLLHSSKLFVLDNCSQIVIKGPRQMSIDAPMFILRLSVL